MNDLLTVALLFLDVLHEIEENGAGLQALLLDLTLFLALEV